MISFFFTYLMFICYDLHTFWVIAFYVLQDVIWMESLSANTAEIVSIGYLTITGSVIEITLPMLRLGN